MKRLMALLCTVGAVAVSAASPAAAQSLISRTITVDGDMADWHMAPAVPDNLAQSSLDCEGSEACEPDNIQSTGRDLKRFAYTWDDENLYFYVERYASANNSNTWLFYLDENTNGRMETGERILQVDWWGSNRGTNAHLCLYDAADAAGDPMEGDGHTLPGGASGCSGNLYSGTVSGGSSAGVEMESRLAWSDLGFDGPANIRFHISSSRGTSLPGHVEDNMAGPGGGGDGDGGGELFPPDMALTIGSSETELDGFEETTLQVTLTNVYYDPFTDVTIEVALPAELGYVSHTAPDGTVLADADGDGTPEVWTVTALDAEEVLVLSIRVRGQALPVAATTTTTTAITGWTGTDSEAGNNAGTLDLALLPSPDLMVAKSASAASALPGAEVTYTVVVTNTAHANAEGVEVRTALAPNLALRLDAFGPGTVFQFTEGATPSRVTLGAAEYSDDGGATWDYTPVSGGGSAPAGHDANVTHWRIPMTGVMASHGASFQVRYVAVVR